LRKPIGSAGLFCSGRAFGFSAVTLVEAIHAPRGIDQLLLAGKERVAGGTDLHVQVALLGRARLERLAAGAGNGYINVFGVNSWFHYSWFDSFFGSTLSTRRRSAAVFKQDMIGGTA
jgi:hypothetical protein